MVAEILPDLNVNTLIALGAFLLAGVAILIKLLDKSLTVREHEEYKTATKELLKGLQERQDQRLVIREFKEWREQVNRDFDRLEDDLRIIDATKPSAETLGEAMKAVDLRVTHLESMIRDLKATNGKA